MAKPTSQAAAGSSRGMGFRGPSLFHQNEYISIYSLDELTIFSQREVLDFGSCQENHYKFKLKHGALIGETKDHAISCQEACMLCLLVIDMLRKIYRYHELERLVTNSGGQECNYLVLWRRQPSPRTFILRLLIAIVGQMCSGNRCSRLFDTTKSKETQQAGIQQIPQTRRMTETKFLSIGALYAKIS
ncbi:predicted protein [Histoplasma capsulatum var. duboisii H88]|uniref:Predicted protein n=2 Tax=Ajellomyces capsulatus TaxID=5037 RepID=F0UAY5_AJEC8|nr:predicted protein [Histoplasma capsulatum H143]EGC43792.1 predicted protein [Histoplasma capsulatum var. duboisii H88]